MVKLIMGPKGTGKTKKLVELVQKAADEVSGDVICVEKEKVLTYDIPHQVRLVHSQEYGIDSKELLRGFITGLAAGNYDISHVFIDNLFKIIGKVSDEDFKQFVEWLAAFGEKDEIEFTISVSAEVENYGDWLKPYLMEV